jgi:hypothetical protein
MEIENKFSFLYMKVVDFCIGKWLIFVYEVVVFYMKVVDFCI